MPKSKPFKSTINVDEIVKKNLQIPREDFLSTLNKERIPVQLLINCIRLLMFKNSKNPQSVIQKLEEDLDKVINMEEIDNIIDKEFSSIEGMYVESKEQLKNDVKNMIGLPGLAKLTPGIGSLNFESLDCYTNQGPKQSCLEFVKRFVRRVTPNSLVVDDIQEFLFDQLAYEMNYCEFVEVSVDVVQQKCYEIMRKLNNNAGKQKHDDFIKKFMKTHSDIPDLTGALCFQIFGNAEHHKRKSFERKLRPNVQCTEQGTVFAMNVLSIYMHTSRFINELKNLAIFKSYKDIMTKNLTVPHLPLHFFANQKNKQSGLILQDDVFVFRKDVEMYIMIRQRMKGTYIPKKAVINDNKIIECVSFKKAVREIVEACGDVRLQYYMSEQPVIGFNSAPPITSPFNTSCKPAIVIFRDFLNFLVYELDIMNSTSEDPIRDVKQYVNRFCKQFQVTREGLYCIDWMEFCKFLDEGRALFRGKLGQSVKINVTPMEEHIELGKLSQMKNKSLETLLTQFADLCIMVHRQNGCRMVKNCALTYNNEHKLNDYCVTRAILPSNSSSVKWPANHYYNALRQILFSNVFENLPEQIVEKLAYSKELLGFSDFQDIILSMMAYFEPIHEKMYCQNIDEMWNIVKSIMSSYTIPLRPCNTVPMKYDRHFEKTNDLLIIQKSDFPSWFFKQFERLLQIDTPIAQHLLELELETIVTSQRFSEFIIIDEKCMKDMQKLFDDHKVKNRCQHCRAEIPDSWLKTNDDPLEHVLKMAFEFILRCKYSGAEVLMKEIREDVMSSDSPMERISEILGAAQTIRLELKSLFEKFPAQYVESYWNIPMEKMPPAILKINVLKSGDKTHKFVFKSDLQLAIRMKTKKEEIYDYDSDDDQNGEEYDDEIDAFEYIDYDEAMEVIRTECGTTVLTKEMIVEMYGYESCMPMLSTFATLCKPVHIVSREYFNYLNFEINIFRLIFDTHFDNFRAIANEFGENMVAEDGMFCIDIDKTQEKMTKGTQLLSAISDREVRSMYIPTMEDLEKYGVDHVVSKLKANVKPGLLREYDNEIDCVGDKLLQATDNKEIAQIAIESIYRAFVKEIPALCRVMHNQKQCGNWGQCTMSFTDDDSNVTRCDFAVSDGASYDLAQCVEMGRNEPRISVEDEQLESTSSSKQVQPVQSVSQKVKKPRREVPKKQDVPLYNSKIIKKCLEILLDKKTYERLLEWNRFKLPKRGVLIEWNGVVEILEKVKTVIPSYDNLLEKMQVLRKCPGSAMLFGIGECLDFWSPDTSRLAEEIRKIHELVQYWLKALQVADYFYHFDKYDRRLSDLLIEHQMDQMAAGIGKSDIVTLRCPKVDLEDIMSNLRDKMKENRIANKEIKDYNYLTTDEEVIKYLKDTAFGDKDCDSGDAFEHVLSVQLKKIEAKERNYFINNLVFKIQRAELIRRSFLESDKHGIIRSTDKRMEKVIRSVRNGLLVFVEDLYDDLPANSDIISYITKEEAQQIYPGSEFVNTDDIRLSVITPVVSSNFTLVVEVSTVFDKILHILSNSSGKMDTVKLNAFMKKLNNFFKPSVSMTFCMDYHQGMELIKEATDCITDTDKAINKKRKITNIQQYIEIESKNQSSPSFEIMLLSLIGDYDKLPSEQKLEEYVEIAYIRTILFEYSQLAKVYHNQKMCVVDGKKQFCSLSLLEEDEMEHYQPCTRIGGHVEKFRKLMVERNMTRLAKEDEVLLGNDQENIEPQQIVDMPNPIEQSVVGSLSPVNKSEVSADAPFCSSDQTKNTSRLADEDKVLSVDDKEDVEPSQIADMPKPMKNPDVGMLGPDEVFEIAEEVETESVVVAQTTYFEKKSPSCSSDDNDMVTDCEVLSDSDKENICSVQKVDTPMGEKKPVVVVQTPKLEKKPVTVEAPRCSTNDTMISFLPKPKIIKVDNKACCNTDRISTDTTGITLSSTFDAAKLRELKLENQRLDRRNKDLNRKLRISESAHTELEKEKKKLEWKTATEIEQLKEEIEKKNSEIEKLKMIIDKSDNMKHITDYQFDKQYYQNFLEKGKQLLAAAECQLNEFLSFSSDLTDRVRAEREFRNFAMDVECQRRKAEENLEILEREPMTTVDLLYKLDEYKVVFGATTLAKMVKKE